MKSATYGPDDERCMASAPPTQLPVVAGDTLAFVWALERHSVDDHYVITAASQLVWRERARTEDWERFNEVKLRASSQTRGVQVGPGYA